MKRMHIMFDNQAVDDLNKLKTKYKKMGLSTSQVVRLALRELAERETE